jgi:cell wall-associated NlpC family hydrolase
MSAVARKYRVSVRELMSRNGISDPTRVPDGKRLIIPGSGDSGSSRSRKKRRSGSEERRILISRSSAGGAVINGDEVAVRSAPGTSSRVRMRLDEGEKVTVTNRRDGWIKIATEEGATGWVRADYLRIKKSASKKQVVSRTRQTAQVAKKTTPKKAASTQTAKREVKKPVEIKVAPVTLPEDLEAAKTTTPEIAPEVKTEVATEEKQENVRRATGRQRSRIPESTAPRGSSEVVRSALSYRGTPYRWGGSSRGGFDCSGFTSYLFRQRGISLPHSASAQFGMGKKVSRDAMQAGDLVFFSTITRGISHVGVYIGEGKFVHASSRRSGGVRVDTLNSGYYSERFRGARRVTR